MNDFFNPRHVDGGIVDKRVITLEKQGNKGEAGEKNKGMTKEIPYAPQPGRSWKGWGKELRGLRLGFDD
jgi:hypothetical protein